MFFLLYRLEEGVRVAGIKGLVGPHHRHQVFGVGQIDDVVGVAGEHDDALDLIS